MGHIGESMKSLVTHVPALSLVAFGWMASAAFAADPTPEQEPQRPCCAVEEEPLSPTAYIVPVTPFTDDDVTGTVTGKIIFEGKEKPKMGELAMTEEQTEGCGEVDAMDRSKLVDDNGGIANVVVFIEVKGTEVKVPEEPVKLDQKGCRFEPHVMFIPVGATVEYCNSDEVSHNVHTYPKKNKDINKTIVAGGSTTQVLDKTDTIKIACDIHPWMSSYLYVTDTPYVAVTAADGSFSIAGLPAGEHKVEIWHEAFGKGKGEAVVKEDGTCEAIEIKMGEEKKGGGRRRR